MEGNPQPQNYLTDDINVNVHYEDIMDPSWADVGTHYGYQPQSQLAHDPYSHPQYNQQASYDHQYAHLQPQQQAQQQQQQPTYPHLPFNPPYSNSPYQQHIAPVNNAYRSSPYSSVDTSLSHSPPFQNQTQNHSNDSFPYSPQETPTIAPHSLQYSAPSSQTVNRSFSNNFSNNAYQQLNTTPPSQETFVNNKIPQSIAPSAQYRTLPQGAHTYGNGAANSNGPAQHVSPYSSNTPTPSSTPSTKTTSVTAASINTPSINSPTTNTAIFNKPAVNVPSINSPSTNITPFNAPAINTPSTTNTARAQPQYAREVVDQGSLRITHPDLLAAAPSVSCQSVSNAPYMFWNTESPIQVAPGLKSKP